MPEIRSFFGEGEKNSEREVLWNKRTDERRGYGADFGEGRHVAIELGIAPALGSSSIEVAAGDMHVKYTLTSGDAQPIGLVSLEPNYVPWQQLPYPYILGVKFEDGIELLIRLGEPHTITNAEGLAIARMGTAWKDSHKGADWLTTVVDESYPWPHLGIAAGLSIWSRLIYQDILWKKYGYTIGESVPYI